MKKNLVIMESPTKAKVVQTYLGKNYRVVSSNGHLTNLSTSKGTMRLGYDIDTHETFYKIIRNKKPTIDKIKKYAETAKMILLATDPDREGEAIAFHLKRLITAKEKNKKNIKRVFFNEINKDMVLKAFENPTEINYELVKAQETRRVIDRIIGFRLSKLLQKKIKSRSAGRVQSVVLKLISEAEKKHQKFKIEEYWTIETNFNEHKFELVDSNKVIKFKNQIETKKISAKLVNQFLVVDVKKTTKSLSPPKPLRTSTLLQRASSLLNFSAARTSLLAQQLYEGVSIDNDVRGLINYPRTDSTRLSSLFINKAHDFIKKNHGDEYINKEFKNKVVKSANVQDAHEALRVSDLTLTPALMKKHLNIPQLKLYTLIYNHSLTCLMSKAQINYYSYSLDNNGYKFIANNKSIQFDGFLIYSPNHDIWNKKPLLKLEKNQIIKIDYVDAVQHFTKPSFRFTESKLIKTMENLGIGRPSTYSSIIKILILRGYVNKEQSSLFATEKGIFTSDVLQKWFSNIINETYTSKVEDVLNQIAIGEINNLELLDDFWNNFDNDIVNAEENMEVVPPKMVNKKCPKCEEGELIYRDGRFGKFIGCTRFPKCYYVMSLLPSIGVCPKCKDGEIIIRVNKRNQKFKTCSLYKDKNCDYAENYIETKEKDEKIINQPKNKRIKYILNLQENRNKNAPV